MRLIFLLAILSLGLWYSYYAFVDLSFLTRTGRLGPGFFPRIIGTGIILFTLLSLVTEFRQRRVEGQNDEAFLVGDVAVIMGLGLLYLIALKVFGGVLATVLFLAIALSWFNRGQHIKNAAISILVPASIYVLFVVVLNAAMPRSMIPLPF